MSDEQIKQKVGAIVAEWWKNCRSPRLLSEDHNFTEIFQAVYDDAKLHAGNVDVHDVERVVRGLGDLDHGGKLIYHKTATQATPVLSNPTANLPFPDEPLLKNLRCMEDITERGAEISKKVLQLGGGADKGGVRNVLLEKLNSRLAHIQTHRIMRKDLPPQEAQPTETTTVVRGPEDSVRCSTNDPRERPIRERILKESRGSRTFMNPYGQRKFRKLNAELDELFRNPEKRAYKDRSGGCVQILRGWAAVEKIMDEKITGYDGPFSGNH